MASSLFMALFAASIVVKVILEFFSKSMQLKQLLTPIFVFCVFAFQIGLVMSISKENCGTMQIKDILIYGLAYCILIFGTTFLLLTMFPGWKEPFSNFFGYGVVNLMGVKDLLNKIMLPKDQSKDPKLNAIIERIYEDHSLLINSFTPDNFNSAMKGLKGIFKPDIRKALNGMPESSKPVTNPILAMNTTKPINQKGGNNGESPNDLIKQLANLVVLKDKIAENIWFAASGWLSLTYASMLTTTSKCNLSPAKLKKHIKDYESHLKSTESKQKEQKNKPGVLTVSD